MRVEGWKGKKVFDDICEIALKNANDLMDDVVANAKARCPVGTITREGKWASGNVSFTPKTGRNRGRLVEFHTERRWMGREPEDLRNTIRRVEHRKRRGNIRVYAGTFKIYWAHMVEFGTSRMAAKPFLRPPFHAAKTMAAQYIKNGK